MLMLFRPRIAPAPRICPRLVVAKSSANPNPFIPDIGIEGPNPLTWIAYLPIKIAIRLQASIIIEFCIDQLVPVGNVLINV